MAVAQPDLRERQPWKAVCGRDIDWFSTLMPSTTPGDDTNVRLGLTPAG